MLPCRLEKRGGLGAMAMGAVLGMALGIDMLKVKRRNQTSSQSSHDQPSLGGGSVCLAQDPHCRTQEVPLSPCILACLSCRYLSQKMGGGGGGSSRPTKRLLLVSPDRPQVT